MDRAKGIDRSSTYQRLDMTDMIKFAIGQRAILIQTPSGNVLWDCITLLDQETVDKVIQLQNEKIYPFFLFRLTIPDHVLRGSRSNSNIPSPLLYHTCQLVLDLLLPHLHLQR